MTPNREERRRYERAGYRHQNCPVCGRQVDMLDNPNPDVPLFQPGQHLTLFSCSPGCNKARARLAELEPKLATMTIQELDAALAGCDDIAPRARPYVYEPIIAAWNSLLPKNEQEDTRAS